MNEIIFEIEVLLCQRFPALSPLAIDEYRAVDVFRLVRDLNDYIDRTEQDEKPRRSTTGKKKRYTVKVTDS